ncbi:hypothetical protein AGMMS49531_04520 [Endomicrobiia bacterium]|nr:hypothetical protein AGMMS49531_04520 [Endomicrobiia bacterium]
MDSKKRFADDKLTTRTSLEENDVLLNDAKETLGKEDKNKDLDFFNVLQRQVNRHKTTRDDLLASLSSMAVALDKAGIKEQALKQISEGLNNDAAQASAKLDAAKENIKKTNRDSNLYQNTINRAINNLTVEDVERVMLNVHDTKMINHDREITHQKKTIGDLAIENREFAIEQESLQKNIDTNQKEFDGIVSVEENNNQEPSKRETQLYKTLEDLKKQKNVVADRIHANNTLIHEAEIKLQQSEQKKAEESEKQTRKNCELVIYTKWLQNKLKWVEYINKVPRQTSKDEIAEQGMQQVDVEHTRAKEQTRKEREEVARVKKAAAKAQNEKEALQKEIDRLTQQPRK